RLHRRGYGVRVCHSPTIDGGLQSFPLRDCAAALAFAQGGTSMAFDPNAATAAYINSLGPAALQKAHDYTVGKEWMLLWNLVAAAVVTWVIVKLRLLDRIEQRLPEPRRNLRAFVVGLVYFIVSAILSLPWSIYADYLREKSYGRTSQPLGDWLGQDALATAISAVIGALFLIGVYWLIRRAGRSWWAWSAGLAAVTLAFMM